MAHIARQGSGKEGQWIGDPPGHDKPQAQKHTGVNSSGSDAHQAVQAEPSAESPQDHGRNRNGFWRQH